MGLPTKLKTWQHATNLNPGFPGSDSNSVAALFILVKDALLDFALNPWTVAGSSDSVTAGMDAVDRLTTYANVVRPGGVHSWIVLEQAAIGCQILFDWASGDPEEVYLYMSPTGVFTGGTTSARPTAADEVTTYLDRHNFVTESCVSAAGTSVRAHVMMSTDGLHTRIVTCSMGMAQFYVFIDVPIDPPAGWSDPVVLDCLGITGGPQNPGTDTMSIYQMLFQGPVIRAQGPAGAMYMHHTVRGFATNGTSNGTAVGYTPWPNADEISGSTRFPVSPVGMVHLINPAQTGKHGMFADLYTTALAVQPGNSFPGDGTKSWVVFGQMVLPWDGGDVEVG